AEPARRGVVADLAALADAGHQPDGPQDGGVFGGYPSAARLAETEFASRIRKDASRLYKPLRGLW
ncbi:hypothetical protein, partial [Streptomyces sp. NPDC059144]|uniref:hypothetical protein n=1 Tax=Streptomyces sp. NPDC059144 TaxID=3346740 RepID=UPI0036A696DE